MPRALRYIFAGTPHHVTQRGNHRQCVFFSDADHKAYLSRLHEYATQHQVEVLAYCLMPNHVHLVLVPASGEGLQRALQRLHWRHARRINRALERIGHLWQGRYFASALDEPHFWAAMRYVELNPVRAGMVERAEDFPWSSARAHCGRGDDDPVLSSQPHWLQRLSRVADWTGWLREGSTKDELERLRAASDKCLPCGSNEFVETLEAATGRCLRTRSPGRPRKKKENGA